MVRYFKRSMKLATFTLATVGGLGATYAAVSVLPVEDVNPETKNRKAAHWDSDWDRRREPNGVSSTTARRHLVLVRHGQYNFSEQDKDCTLTELGRRQLDGTGKRLSELGIKFDRIVYSTMTRAMESGQIISQHLPQVPVETCSLIREGPPVAPVPPLNAKHIPHVYERSSFAASARIEAGFRKFFHRAPPVQKDDSYEIIVCHANVIRYYVCRALQLPPEAWLRFSLNHGSLTCVTICGDGSVSLNFLGNSGFLPKDMLTTS